MILCCGEALIDMLPAQTTDGRTGFVPHPGGAALNAAIAISRLGAPAGLATGLSCDMFGSMLEASLRASGVSTDFLVRSTRQTPLAFVTLDKGQARYAFFDSGSAGRMVTPDDFPDPGAGVAALLFGGISLIPEPCGSAYEALMRRSGQSRLTILDLNIRPGFVEDREAYLARLHRMIAMSDILKLSEDDLRWLDDACRPEEFARGRLGEGPCLVVVTKGAQGASAWGPGFGAVSAPAPEVRVVDTVGAGDAFSAGLVTWLSERGLLSRESISAMDATTAAAMLVFAVGVAALSVTRAGADAPWRHELSRVS